MTRVLVADDPLELGTVVANALAARAEVLQPVDLVPVPDRGSDGDSVPVLCETIARCRPEPDVVVAAWPTIDRPRLEALTRLLGSNPVATLVIAAAVDDEVGPRLEAVTCDAVDVLLTGTADPSALDAGFTETLRDRIAALEGMDVSSLAVAQTAATASSIQAAHTACAGSRAVADSAAGSGDSAGATTGGGASAIAGGADERTGSAACASRRTVTAPDVTAPDGASIGARPSPPSDDASPRRRPHSDTKPDAHAATGPRDDDGLQDSRTPGVPPTVVVGASTGGPAVVEDLLAGLPRTLEARVFVVQHMPAVFTGRFADRLDAASEYAVAEPDDGDRVEPGTAVVAPGDTHLRVDAGDDGLCVALEPAPSGITRPSIDVTMESVAQTVDGPLCGVVCTGMGRDGAAGIEAIADAGGHTIAQDEATSSVFGIPAQAIRTGCVDTVVPADELPDRVLDALGGDHRDDG